MVFRTNERTNERMQKNCLSKPCRIHIRIFSTFFIIVYCHFKHALAPPTKTKNTDQSDTKKILGLLFYFTTSTGTTGGS